MSTYFVTGASGYIGSHIVRRLVHGGHEVLGLSRSEESDTFLTGIGARPIRGDVAEGQTLERMARQSDGVIYAARYCPSEGSALEAIGRRLGDKPFVFISGASVGAEETAGHRGNFQFAETTPLMTPPKGSAIRLVSEALVQRAPRGIVVRPPLVYGAGGSAQIPLLAKSARETGTLTYVGPGENAWGYVHVDDLARLVMTALSLRRPASIYHAVAGEVLFKDLASAIGEVLGMPAVSVSLAKAEELYGKFPARVMLGSSCRPTSQLTREALNWSPQQLNVLDDVRFGSYRTAFG